MGRLKKSYLSNVLMVVEFTETGIWTVIKSKHYDASTNQVKSSSKICRGSSRGIMNETVTGSGN